MNLLFYFLEANLYLLIFFAFYILLLRKETFYHLNRYYLLSSPVVSFILPAFKIGALQPALERIPQTYQPVYEPIETGLRFEDWISIGYVTITCIGILKLLWDASKIVNLARKLKVRKLWGLKVVTIGNKPFSFFNYLFINPEAKGLTTIFRHEKVHIRQLHSLDITFFEFLKILNWFNPFVALMQKEIKAIHEFLADAEASKITARLDEYATFLIQNSNTQLEKALINQMFNQSLLKKRIIMLSKKKSPPVARLKFGLMFMMLPALVCGSSMAFSKNYGYDLASYAPVQDSAKGTVRKKVPPPPPPAAPLKLRAIPDKKLGVPPPPPPVPPTKHRKNDPQYKSGEVKFPAPKILPSKGVSNANKSIPKPKVRNVKFPPPVLVPKKEANTEKTPPLPSVEAVPAAPGALESAKASALRAEKTSEESVITIRNLDQ